MTPLALSQMEWLCACLEYTGYECLVWPFYRLKGGYAKTTSLGGQQYLASRLVCELVKGPPPTPKHEAAHSCGRGKHGCVTPRHLDWKTAKENRLDKRLHGTAWNVGGKKLSVVEVQEIRAIGNAENQREIAARFGITQPNVSMILAGKTWPEDAVRHALGGES